MASRSPKSRNEPIGECRCPFAGCELVGKVFRFRARPDQTRQRFAGKLYLQCPTHGRVGADGVAATQDFILENATIWTPETKPAPASVPATTPAPPAPKPAPSTPRSQTVTPIARPAPKASTTSRDLWDL